MCCVSVCVLSVWVSVCVCVCVSVSVSVCVSSVCVCVCVCTSPAEPYSGLQVLFLLSSVSRPLRPRLVSQTHLRRDT